MEFIRKDDWSPNSLDLNPLDCHLWGAVLEMYQLYTPKPTNTYGVEERSTGDLG